MVVCTHTNCYKRFPTENKMIHHRKWHKRADYTQQPVTPSRKRRPRKSGKGSGRTKPRKTARTSFATNGAHTPIIDEAAAFLKRVRTVKKRIGKLERMLTTALEA